MVVKYVREDFREHARGSHRDFPPPWRPTFPFPKTQWTRVQILFLLALIALLFILDSLQTTREPVPPAVSVADGVVTSKHVETDLKGNPHYMIGIRMTFDDTEPVAVEAECSKTLWQALSPGTSVSVSYYPQPRDGKLIIRNIEPTKQEAQEEDSSDASDVSPRL